MGRKKVKSGLGKSIIRDRFGKQRRSGPDSYLHTSDLGDGYDWNRINLRSVTEETSLDEFLATAQLAGTEFTAERLNVKFVSEESRAGLLSADEAEKIQQVQNDHRSLLRIPRRPHWDKETSAEQLDLNERESFLEWRRQLATLQDVEGIVMTPFERNLDFWRQLWRVTERSDVVVQIVDARNPLLFRCQDLEQYVKEVDSSKLNMILINKADYLSQKQRELWASYFDQEGLLVAFWSATEEKERLEAAAKQTDELGDGSIESNEDESDDDEDYDTISEDGATDDDDDTDSVHEDIRDGEENAGAPVVGENVRDSNPVGDVSCEGCQERERQSATECSRVQVDSSAGNICDRVGQLNTRDGDSQSPSDCTKQTSSDSGSGSSVKSNPNILNGLELIELLQSLCKSRNNNREVSIVGLVGYPNVGKSSSINALLQTKKVPVSATPGRTKHFQTLYLDKTLMLCDCPGLVMPSFVNTKADMVLSGILPIDQMRDYVTPVATLATLIPRAVLEAVYGIMIPRPREGEDEDRPPTAHELLSAYGYMRGFMTHKGIPDFQRSARHILKDFVVGKLLYCTAPPGASVEDFCPTAAPEKPAKERSHLQPAPVGARHKAGSSFTNEVDQMFFEKVVPSMGMMGATGTMGRSHQESSEQKLDSNAPSGSQASLGAKPWKKHHNRGKKEKLRRIHSYLDA